MNPFSRREFLRLSSFCAIETSSIASIIKNSKEEKSTLISDNLKIPHDKNLPASYLLDFHTSIL
ncbi:MAG: hypothetical protein ACP5UA_06930 [Candidatus Hydrogenedens sp.]